MARTSKLTASALLGGLIMLGTVPAGAAQSAPPPIPQSQTGVERPGGTPGRVVGEVTDEQGRPIRGAIVSVIGETLIVAVTDERGRFELAPISPGHHQLRAHSVGHLAARLRPVLVHAGAGTRSSFALRRAPSVPAAGTGPTVLAAGMAVQGESAAEVVPPSSEPVSERDEPVPAEGPTEVVWRLRHLRRGVLREASVPDDFLEKEGDRDSGSFVGLAGRAMSSPARMATSLFADLPLKGQLHFLTTNSLDTPQHLLSGANLARGIAYVKVGAPVGDNADWTVRGAVTQADLSSWFVAGAYTTKEPARRARDIGMSYSTQYYVGGNPLALRALTDGSRNAGTVYAFETFTFSPAIAVTYGARYERYDYLDRRDLFSPRASLSLGVASGTRLSVGLSSRADAPGALEFLPPSENGLWLPPQRTFSATDPREALRAERTTQLDAGIERALGPASISVRGFRQRVDGQMLTLFGVDVPAYPGSQQGHYVVGSVGNVDATGGAIALRSSLGPRVRGTVTYSVASAAIAAAGTPDYVVLHGAAGPAGLGSRDRIHDVSTSIVADVPETATRVLVFYRIGNGYASHRDDADQSGVDSRFDIQLRQSLPFLNFTSARWEMLVALRNFFRDPESEQSLYDELLTVRAPRRLVGGVSLHF